MRIPLDFALLDHCHKENEAGSLIPRFFADAGLKCSEWRVQGLDGKMLSNDVREKSFASEALLLFGTVSQKTNGKSLVISFLKRVSFSDLQKQGKLERHVAKAF